jgi:ribose transport system substrate-binding protein
MHRRKKGEEVVTIDKRGRRWVRSRGLAVSAAVILVVTAIAGCGGSGSSSSSQAVDTTAASGSGGGSGSLAKMEASVKNLLGPVGTYEAPPTAPVTPKGDQTVALISCGQSFPACSNPMNGAKEAAEAVGWKVELFDSKGDTNAAGAGIRRAVANGDDGIFIYYIDCQYLKAPLEEAKRAGVPVVAAESVDCNESSPGAPALFTSTVTYAGGDNYISWVKKWWEAQLEYAIVKEQGEANILMFTDNTQLGSKAIVEATEELVPECSSCTDVIHTFPFANIGTSLQGEVEQEMLKNPDTNVVMSGYEAVLVGGVAAGLQASSGELLVSAAEGGRGGIQMMREDKAQFAGGIPVEWEGWAGIDGLVRLLAGQKPQSSGIGVQLLDTETNMPSGPLYEPPVDYQKLYEKSWGV